MKALIALALCLASLTGLHAQEKKSLATHPLFKLLVGEWKSTGTLTAADGKVIKVTEEWKGSVTAEGTFVMEGHLKLDEKPQDYRWTFTHNSATDAYAADRTVPAEDQTKHFEVSVSDVALSMDLTAPLGDDGGVITLKDSFTDDKHETMTSEVAIKGGGGDTHLSGTITHKRQPNP